MQVNFLNQRITMQTHRNPGFITLWVSGIPVWEHSAGSGPSIGISHQLCSCGFHQLILLGAEISNTMDFYPKIFSAQQPVWFGCGFGDWQRSPYPWY